MAAAQLLLKYAGQPAEMATQTRKIAVYSISDPDLGAPAAEALCPGDKGAGAELGKISSTEPGRAGETKKKGLIITRLSNCPKKDICLHSGPYLVRLPSREAFVLY